MQIHNVLTVNDLNYFVLRNKILKLVHIILWGNIKGVDCK